MSDGPRVGKDFVVISTLRRSVYFIRWSTGADLICFVTKEMNLFEPFVFDVFQCIGLVPTVREYIKRDLTANRKGETILGEFFL